MKFRRAATLAVSFEGTEIAVHNFLTKDSFSCSESALTFLSRLDDWHTAEQLFGYFPDVDRSSLAEQVTRLVEFNAILVEDTEQAQRDERYRTEWQWGVVAGFYHFSIRGTQFITGKAARNLIRKRRKWRPSPSLYKGNSDASRVISLPKTDLEVQPFALMRRRRSERKFTSDSISLSVLADCLFCGNGIVGFHDDEDYGHLPLTMTPSGGARNPFELYVYANRVSGLETGFYHYSALDHDLGLIRAGKVEVADMLGSQDWPGKAAAVVFLVAHFPRSMWKYHLATAYRVVLMEAGFIAQNIALTATHYGLSAVPSGAFNEALIEGYLGTPEVESGVILSISLGRANGN